MEHKIKLPLPLLRAALIAAAEDDFLRPSIESVVVDKGHIVATNGHMMFWAKLDEVDPELRIVIPRINVECFIKKTENSGRILCDLVYDTETERGYLEIPRFLGAYESFKTYFLKYLDWQKVIPATGQTDDGYPQFQTKYHAKLDEIAAELGNICSPKIIPNGQHKPAPVEFLYSEFDNVHVCLMPLDLTYSKVKYCVEILDEPDNADAEQLPAESAEIAVRAAQRLRKDLTDGSSISQAAWIRPALWLGTEKDYREKMFYTEEWFNQPLRQYSDAERAIKYLNAMPGEVVRCFVGDILTGPETHARTAEEVIEFFAGHSTEEVT